MDDVGAVYFHENVVLRAINNTMKGNVIELMNSGLIERLVNEGLFPKTTISKHKIDGCDLILEHEKINTVSYPFEWSPEMLRQAGLCVLKVNAIANEYGYELKDSHVYNVVFKYAQPMCVDFGSIVKRNVVYRWVAYGRFKCAYIYPLKLYAMGATTLFNNLFLVSGKGIEEPEYLKVRFSFLRLLSNATLTKITRVWEGCRNVNSIPKHILERKLSNVYLIKLINFIMKARVFDSCKLKQETLADALQSLKWKSNTFWGTYHQRVGLYSASGEVNLTRRFELVTQLVNKLNVSTVLELAGNQGILSKELVKLPSVNSVICSDYDENAVDRLFLNIDDLERITPVRMDFMRSPIASRADLATNRFKSELVIALAVTHHLFLTQGYSLDCVLETMLKYSSRYLMVEFMPIGLYSKRSNLRPSVPTWYNEEWFVNGLNKFGGIIERTQLEENRILFLIEMKQK